MRQLASGVCIITLGVGEDRTGLTATSVFSLSAEPPTLLVCVDRGSSSYAAFERFSVFAVNVLAADQREFAERFAGGPDLKRAELLSRWGWRALPNGLSCLADWVAVFDCEVDEQIERHSQAIVIGRVRRVLQGGASGALYTGAALMTRSAGAGNRARDRPLPSWGARLTRQSVAYDGGIFPKLTKTTRRARMLRQRQPQQSSSRKLIIDLHAEIASEITRTTRPHWHFAVRADAADYCGPIYHPGMRQEVQGRVMRAQPISQTRRRRASSANGPSNSGSATCSNRNLSRASPSLGASSRMREVKPELTKSP